VVAIAHLGTLRYVYDPDHGVLLTSVAGTFHAKVLEARLASEGIVVELRGYSEGPYPIPTVIDVFVHEDEVALAREILLADAVDAAFIELAEPQARRRRRWIRRPRAES
jgi:hypothetical protein